MKAIDVSHWNGKIDWKTVKQANPELEFVYIKSSTGIGGVDPKALWNATEAKKVGLKIGYYHYCSMNDENELDDSTKEANWFLHVLSLLPSPDMPVALDIEDPKILPSLDDGEVLAWIKNFFSIISTKYDHVLYSFTPFLNEHLPSSHDLGTTKLWIAQFRNKLTLPKGWTKEWLWQYTDKGSIKGIKGNVDLNK